MAIVQVLADNGNNSTSRLASDGGSTMARMELHRKKVKHYHEVGDFHEFTFSCYRRMPLLTNDRWREYLSGSIDEAAGAQQFRLVAFVFMPEHVHLLMFPTRADTTAEDLSVFLAATKTRCSQKIKQDLEKTGHRMLKRLTVRERPSRSVFRFWQEGPGYDRNLQTQASVTAAINYIHLNPVRRGLCEAAIQWRWSSARWYITEGAEVDPQLPTIHGPPPDFYL